MILSDGVTAIEFFPVAYEARAEDFTELLAARNGEVIAAAAAGGHAPRRTRQVSLIRTTAQRATLLTLLADNDGAALAFTDDVGRIWDVYVLDDYESSEEANADDGLGWHRVTLRLWLAAVNDDTGREAYANADASQMSIQKSGAAVLYFPLAFAPPLGRVDFATARKRLGPAALHVDEGRFTAKRRHSLSFAGLERAFVSELEDYYVETIKGATYPFTLAHFRETTTVYRWIGGFAFSQDEGGSYSSGMELVQEV